MTSCLHTHCRGNQHTSKCVCVCTLTHRCNKHVTNTGRQTGTNTHTCMYTQMSEHAYTHRHTHIRTQTSRSKSCRYTDPIIHTRGDEMMMMMMVMTSMIVMIMTMMKMTSNDDEEDDGSCPQVSEKIIKKDGIRFLPKHIKSLISLSLSLSHSI